MKSVKYLIMIAMCAFSVSSCAMKMDDVKPGTTQPENAFYTLKDGVVYAVDKNGEMIPLRKVTLPFKHDVKAVKSVETLTIIKLEGSHIELICPSPFYCFTY
ncbi:MAG: hypothetical protein AB2724_16225 [Candidatus Thiodiazotropha sp.]